MRGIPVRENLIMRGRRRLIELLALWGLMVLVVNCAKPIIVHPPPEPLVSPAPTFARTAVGSCTKLEVPAFLIDQRQVSGTVHLSAPAHLSPKVTLSPEGCTAGLVYHWFSDGKPMSEWDDFPTIPLNPQYLSAEQTLRVVICMKPIGQPVEASIKIVVSK